MNGRGRHFEHKIWFLIINQVQPTLFTKNLSFIKFKGDLATETNEDNDFTTVIHIVIILCFIEHLCYPQGPAEMFGNVFNLMECYLQLSPDVILLVMSAASKLVGIASKLDWYSEAKTEA